MAAGTSSGRINVKGYVLLDKLGSGSYATVYKAHKSVSHSPCFLSITNNPNPVKMLFVYNLCECLV